MHSESPTPLLVTRGSVLQGAPERLVSLSPRGVTPQVRSRGPLPFGPQFPFVLPFLPCVPIPMRRRSVCGTCPIARSSQKFPCSPCRLSPHPSHLPNRLIYTVRKEGCRLIPLRFSTCTPTFQRFATTVLLKGGLSFPSLSLSLSLLFPF